jgi:hypothetical protein
MQYVLGVGFIVEKYKKNPNVRIFLDDLLIDEYEIDQHETARLLTSNSFCWRLLNWEKDPPSGYVARIKKEGDKFMHRKRLPGDPPIPKHFKFFIINSSVLRGKSKISLEIDNNDSNYTNGFMSRSTIIDARNIFLIPIDFIKFFKSDGETFHKNMGKVIPKKYNGSTHIWDFGADAKVLAGGYPFPLKYHWQGKTLHQEHTVGGSGTLSMDLVEKNSIIMFDPYEEALTFLLEKEHIDEGKKDPVTMYDHIRAMQIAGLTKKQAKAIISTGQVPAFPFSRTFFTLAWNGVFDKYSI